MPDTPRTVHSPDKLYPADNFDYRLLDCGEAKKLEQFGPHCFVRPAPQVIWPKGLDKKKWQMAAGEYSYSQGKEFGGEWTWFSETPQEGWTIAFQDLVFLVKPTGFGHMGLFPEQAPNWVWIYDTLKNFPEGSRNILNIFGYTGASTLSAARAGARVTHVDSSKASITWARQNLELSGLGDRPVRWIVDDVLKFLKREQRRGTRYDGIILDPPTFGRGARSEVWKIEKDLPHLLQQCKNVLSDDPLFVLFTTHSPGFSSLLLENLLKKYIGNSANFESGEMFIPDSGSGLHLPNGFYSRWTPWQGRQMGNR